MMWENFLDARPASPMAPVPKRRSEAGSGTGEVEVVIAVAENVTGPKSWVLKVKLPGVVR